MRRVCANCGASQGPFTLVFPTIRVCGPAKFEKETAKLIGRIPECNERRRKQEIARFGQADNPYA